MPGQSQQQTTSTSTSTSTSAPATGQNSTPDHGNAANAEQCNPVNECAVDPMQEMRDAISTGDGCGAWGYYQQLPSEDQVELYGDRTLQAGLVGVVYDAYGLPNVEEIFRDLCLTLPLQLELADTAGILDPTSADAILNATDVTPEEQAALADDPAMMSVLHTHLAGQAAHEVFRVLAGEPVLFIETVGRDNGLTIWVFETHELAVSTVGTLGEHLAWIDALQPLNKHDELLQIIADTLDIGWWDAFTTHADGFDWICTMATRPISDDLLPGFNWIFGNGEGYSLEQKFAGFAVLYGDGKLGRAGSDFDQPVKAWTSNTGTAGHIHFLHHVVDPNDDAMTIMLEQYSAMPRNLIALCSQVMMTDYHQIKFVSSGNPDQWLDASDNFVAAQASAKQFAKTTSFFTPQNVILYRSTDQHGTPDSRIANDLGTGTGAGPWAVNRFGAGQADAPAAGNMSLFENHATHEMGHAVGARPFNKAPASGKSSNEYTKTTYGWDDGGGTKEGYARTLGFTSTMDTTNYTLTEPIAPTSVPTTGAVIRDFLAEVAAGNTPAPAALVDGGTNKFIDAVEVMAAIGSHNTLKNSLIYKTVQANGGNKGNCHFFNQGLGAGASDVHFFSTNYGDKWVKYKAECWNQRPSHYAVSAHYEFFAEAYAVYFTGGRAPAKLQTLLTALETAETTDFGNMTPGSATGATTSSGPAGTPTTGSGLNQDPLAQGEGEGEGQGEVPLGTCLQNPVPELVIGRPLS
ncbi:MAG: hypothetical protein JRI25_11585 [Deltaproteobacteria bacterium]|nr:hypothetical protein [Deltaproteobacteria bacterium]